MRSLLLRETADRYSVDVFPHAFELFDDRFSFFSQRDGKKTSISRHRFLLD